MNSNKWQTWMQTKPSIAYGLFVAGLLCANQSAAQPFDPVEELFRFGQEQHLILDRGGPVDQLGDVNGDGLADIVIGSGVGGVRVVFGPTNGNNGTLNILQIKGNSGFTILHDSVNLSYVSGIGDLNADGFDDVLVGSLGGAHVIFGRGDGFASVVDVNDLTGADGFSFDSTATFVSDAGDVNGDGIVDIIIGNSTAGANDLTGAGASYIIFGSRSRFPAMLRPSDLNGEIGFIVLGTNTEDRSGKFVGAAGDFNHDGIDDFMIGAPNKTQNAKAEVGEAYLIYGRSAGFPAAISLSDINGNNGFVFKGSNIQDLTGSAVTGIGDLNHDGIADIAISAPGKGPFGSPTDYPGEVYVLFGGNFDGVRELNEQSLDGNNGFVARGIRGGVVPIEVDEAIWGDLAGTSVDGAGDFNDDGIDDLLIGASHTIINPQRKGVGQIYVIYGTTAPFSQRFNLADIDGDNGFRIDGIGTTDYFGVYSRKAGDFNDDGRDDIIIGASGQGNSYIIYGRDPWAPVQPSPAPVALNGASSNGFEAIAFNAMPNSAPLLFNELADPAGPNPLPPTTPVVLGDPATPGDIPANIVVPVEPLRPSDNAVEETQTTPDVTDSVESTEIELDPSTDTNTTDNETVTPVVESTNDNTNGSTDTTDETLTTAQEPTGDSIDNNAVVTIGGGALWHLSFVLLLLLRLRRNTCSN